MFRYCAAIAHSPQYESDHKDSLSQGWPHIPITKDRAEFEHIVGLGNQLATLLDPLADATGVIKVLIGKDTKTLAVVGCLGDGNVKQSDLQVEYSYYGAATGHWVERPPSVSESLREEWGEVTGDLSLNRSVFLANIPHAIWRYELGGYPVIKKWLGYRQANRRHNAPLSLQELDDLRGIVLRIAALLTLRPQLDAAYEKATSASWSFEEFSLDKSA